MNPTIFDDYALEKSVQDGFGLSSGIDQIIVNKVDISRTATATVFLSDKKQLFCYIEATSRLVLDDVMKLVNRMGLKAESYLPPKNQPTYFDDFGRSKFRSTFPGRGNVTDSDIIFYRKLSPYNPALIIVQEVKDGHIYQYDADSKENWRIAAKFAYRRIKTS